MQQGVELKGYVIVLVETPDGNFKLYGSPADKDNLEVRDEILDVNENTLEGASRQEVIKHVHEVIFFSTYQFLFNKFPKYFSVSSPEKLS